MKEDTKDLLTFGVVSVGCWCAAMVGFVTVVFVVAAAIRWVIS